MTKQRVHNKVYVVGVGMTKFEKPGRHMAREAVTKALLDAGITYTAVESAYVGYCYGDSTCGQRALYQFGQTQIPIVNVNNNCSTGSTALYMARQQIAMGAADCVLALGFEKMDPGSLSSKFDDRTAPLGNIMSETRGFSKGPPAAQIFGNAGIEYCEKYGATADHMAKIGEKNHRHSAKNPYSQFRDIYTLEQVKQSRAVHGPLTMLQCCPTSDGGAAAILASESFVREHHLEAQAVELAGQAMATDSPQAMAGSAIELAGADMTRRAAQQVYAQTGVAPTQVGVVELHDCFSANELITYDALGLCPPGKAHIMVDQKENTFGGRCVVNPSGGLISKGHPLGATGLAQCAELVWQLRGWCGERQVPRLQAALQHNIGLGGAVVVSLYRPCLLKPEAGSKPAVDPRQRFGYNPAIECRDISKADFDRVVAAGHSNYLTSHL
ncbi:thiolase-like protein [Syncephalis pseudoplumigaleata]|uniref:propanoyl-CoA C-acyltransferase n=1 Tax=Syncephalis pseudoplumigaleata TaxID=1712513 RepID=A0A4P9Z7V6_9FUNG|nr:thiolase-like protein [Syncephalis pseudoplumigaleata]|eukprot:RKP27810.1 thiolase-like protein [Syncephalis pseudoplumigaleata]